MPIFNSNDYSFFIVSSYKCGYTTLYNSDKISLVRKNEYYRNHYLKTRFIVLLQSFFRRKKTYMIFRDPYERAESCYFDKILNAESMDLESKYIKTLFSAKDLNFSGDNKKNILITKNISFEDFILKILPQLHDKEAHFFPQYKSTLIGVLRKYGINYRLRIDAFFNLKNKNDMKKLSLLTSVDFEKKFNVSKKHKVEWSSKMYKVFNEIYLNDFKLLKIKVKV